MLWPNIATAGQKYIREIGNWLGPYIFIAEGGLLLRPELLWPDCTVFALEKIIGILGFWF